MHPQANSSLPIPFNQLGDKPFERLCRHLLREQPGVKSARLFGHNQQGQKGIDVIIELTDKDECWAAQCKAYASYSKGDFEKAVNEFRRHLKYWKKQNLSRFIVFVGCGLVDRFVQEELKLAEAEFAKEGINVEIWDSDEIARRLKPFPLIVKKAFPSHTAIWLETICDIKEPIVSVEEATWTEDQKQLQSLVDELGGLRNAELDNIRDMIRTGAWPGAEKKLKELQAAETWQVLPEELKARTLRMHAGLIINQRDDLKRARMLLKKADALGRVAPSRFHAALLASQEEGLVEALEEIENPETLDEWHLRAILLVNTKRFGDALELLKSGEFEENAETFRIRAIANLHLRRPAAAREEIELALTHSPTWFTVLEAAAKIYFYSSISSDSPDWGIWTSPAPVRWEFVKSDPESKYHLEKAEELSFQLVSTPEIGPTDLLSAKCWHLACLANQRDDLKQEQANSLAQEILKGAPLTLPAVVWALERRYEIPVGKTRTLLEEQIESTPTLENVHALLVLLIRTGEFTSAATLLDRYREIYEDTENLNTWNFHRIQIAYVNEEAETIRVLTKSEEDPSLIAIRTEGAKEGWTDSRLSALVEEYEDTKSAEALFNACEAHHIAGRSDFVVEHADSLLKALPSESALALTINAAYSSGNVAECIRISTEYSNLFQKGEIPEDVRRLRAWCFSSLGKHSEAAQELRMIDAPKLSEFDRATLLDAEYLSGNTKQTLKIAENLVANEHATPELLLQIIDRTRVDNPNLAQKAFEKLKKSGTDDPNLAARAYYESFHLGLEHEAKEFLKTAAAEMGKPGSALVPFSVEEYLKHQQESHQAREERMNLYRRGEIPIHLLESAGDDTLSDLITLTPEWVKRSKSHLSSSWSLKTRHGSIRKSRIRTADSPKGGIFLDSTSLLILQQLDLLPKLEEAISPVTLSASTNAWIQKQIHDLSAQQLSQKTSKQSVIALCDQGDLEELELSGDFSDLFDLEETMGATWCEMLQIAVRTNGYLVDFVPVTENKLDGQPVDLPPEISERVLGALQLCVSAREAGFLSLEGLNSCLARLDKRSDELPKPVALDESSTIVLDGGQAEHLASIGILDSLANSCQVLMESKEITRIRSNLRFEASRDELVIQLKNLRDHIREKIDKSEFVEETSSDNSKHSSTGEFEADPLMRCVRDTLNPGRSKDVWTCVDDRRFSVQQRIGKSRVVGTYDIVDFLSRTGQLTVREMYEVRRQMRLRNFRFIQADSDEIVTLLEDCFKRESGGEESVELADLRKYYAGVFLNGDDLQRPQGNLRKARVFTELRVLLQTGAVAAEALFAIWSNDKDSEALRMIKSDWILDSVWFDASGTNKILSQFEVSPDLERIASQHLLFLALRFTHEKDESIAPYLSWVFSRLTSRPSRWIPILTDAKKFLFSSVRNLDSEENIELKKYTVFKMHEKIEEALPPELKPFFAIADEDRKFLEEAQYLLVGIGPFQFDASDLWPAARSALNGDPAQVQPIKAPEGYETLELVLDEEALVPTLRFDSESEEKGFTWEQPLLTLLSNSTSGDPGGDEDLRKSLDMDCEHGMKELSRMRDIEDLSERIHQYSEIETKSIPRQLRSITEKLKNESELDLTLARPRNLGTLLQHVRISPGNKPETILTSLEEAAKTLIREEGFIEAFKRHSSLPYLLSPPFFREFKKLPNEERLKFQTYAKGCDTVPLTALHAATLLLAGEKAEKEEGVALICRILEEDKVPLFQYFQRILEWSFSCLLNDHVGEINFFDHMIAAWVHSGRVHQTIGSPTEYVEIGNFFARNRPSIAGLNFLPEFSRFEHPINPTIFHPPSLVLGAVSRAIQEVELTDAERSDLGTALKPLCFPYKNHADHPDVRLCQLSGKPYRLDSSLLDFFEITNVQELPGLEDFSKAFPSTMHDAIGQTLKDLEQNPNDVELWLTLAGMVGINRPSKEHGVRLRQLVSKISFSDLDVTPEMLTKLGMFIFNLTRFPCFRESETIWNSLATDFGSRLLDPSFTAGPKNVAQACLFAASSLPIGDADTPGDANQRVADILRSMVSTAGGCPKELRQMVSNLANMIPGRDNAPLWKLLLELREY